MHSLQFTSIWSAAWWSLSTLVTVGYGDYVPRTLTGQIIGMFAMVCSVLLLSLPIAILGSKFHEVYTLNQMESNFSDGQAEIFTKAATMEFENLGGSTSVIQELQRTGSMAVEGLRRMLTNKISRVSAFSSPRSSRNSEGSSPRFSTGSDGDADNVFETVPVAFPAPMSSCSDLDKRSKPAVPRNPKKSIGFHKSVDFNPDVLNSAKVQDLVQKIRTTINKLGEIRESSLLLTSQRILAMNGIHQQTFTVFKSIADPVEFQHEAHSTAQKFFSLLHMEMRKTQPTYQGHVLTEWSLGTFHHTSKWRQRALWIIQRKHFDSFILVLIGFNTLLMATHEYRTPGSLWNQTKDSLDIVFLVIFTFEAFLKIVSLGFYNHPHSYLRHDGWNVFDFIIVVIGLVLSFTSVPTSFARIFRVFRPLRMMSRMPSMRRLVDSIVSALPHLVEVMVFCVFLLFIFSIVGLQLWAGITHQRCRITSRPLHFSSMGSINSSSPHLEHCQFGGDFWCIDVSNRSDVRGINLPDSVSAAVLHEAFCTNFGDEFPTWRVNGCVDDLDRVGHWTVWPVNPDDASLCGSAQCGVLTAEPGSFLDRNRALQSHLALLESSNIYEGLFTYCALNYDFAQASSSENLAIKSNKDLIKCLAQVAPQNSSVISTSSVDLSDQDSSCLADVYAPVAAMSTVRTDFILDSNQVADSDVFLPDFNFGFTNFDHMPRAVVTMFQVLTMEGWTDIAYLLWDAEGAYTFPLLFFMILLGSFYLLNVMIAVFSEAFASHHELAMEEEEFDRGSVGSTDSIITRDESHPSSIASKASRALNAHFSNRIRPFFKWFTEHHLFDRAMNVVILTNAIIIMLDCYPAYQHTKKISHAMEQVFLAFFAFEMMCMLIARGPRSYCVNQWLKKSYNHN